MDILKAEGRDKAGTCCLSLRSLHQRHEIMRLISDLHLKYLFPEWREANCRMRVFVDVNAHKQCLGTFAYVHTIKKISE